MKRPIVADVPPVPAPQTTVIEASSGSTAVSEAYFAKMLGLRFIAVVPASTAAPKLDAIQIGRAHV